MADTSTAGVGGTRNTLSAARLGETPGSDITIGHYCSVRAPCGHAARAVDRDSVFNPVAQVGIWRLVGVTRGMISSLVHEFVSAGLLVEVGWDLSLGRKRPPLLRDVVGTLLWQPIAAFLLYNYIADLSKEILESAHVDGASFMVTVLTAQLQQLVGTRGEDWHLLTAGAFVSMVVPLVVFLAMQRYFVRGLLTGGVKG